MTGAKSILEKLCCYSDGIEGKNELVVGLLMCNSAMIEAASTIESQLSEIATLRDALEKVKSYNVDIHAGRINYRPLDHIEAIDAALTSTGAET